jgi:hypothetical protein
MTERRANLTDSNREQEGQSSSGSARIILEDLPLEVMSLVLTFLAELELRNPASVSLVLTLGTRSLSTETRIFSRINSPSLLSRLAACFAHPKVPEPSSAGSGKALEQPSDKR